MPFDGVIENIICLSDDRRLLNVKIIAFCNVTKPCYMQLGITVYSVMYM